MPAACNADGDGDALAWVVSRTRAAYNLAFSPSASVPVEPRVTARGGLYENPPAIRPWIGRYGSSSDFDRTKMIKDLGDIYGDVLVRPADHPEPPIPRSLKWGLAAAAIALALALVCFFGARRGLDSFDRHERLVTEKVVTESSWT